MSQSSTSNTNNYMDDVTRLNQQFPDHKKLIIRLRNQFPDLNIHELRKLLLTEISDTSTFHSHRVLNPAPSHLVINPKIHEASQEMNKDKIVTPSKSKNRLMQTLRKPQKVSNPFNKLVKLHKKQIKSNPKQDFDSIPSMADESFSFYTQKQACIQMVNPSTGHKEWRLVDGLEEDIIRQHEEYEQLQASNNKPLHSYTKDIVSTKIFLRDPNVGLGMTIRENNGSIFVHALVCQDGTRLYGNGHMANPNIQTANTNNNENDKNEKHTLEHHIHTYLENGLAGPAHFAGVRPGDQVLGLNGKAFLRGRPFNASNTQNTIISPKGNDYTSSSVEILRNAAQTILNTPDPILLHVHPSSMMDQRMLELERVSDSPSASLAQLVTPGELSVVEIKESENDKSTKGLHNHNDVQNDNERNPNPNPNPNLNPNPRPMGAVHPFAEALTKRGLLQSGSDESIVTMQLNAFTARTRQWENTSFFYVNRLNNNKLMECPNGVQPPRKAQFRSHLLFTPSTPPSTLPSSAPQPQSMSHSTFPGNINSVSNDGIFIPLSGIRKSLCARIVNSFTAGNRTAYTVWVYDIELGKEWYAPVRYYSDFKDLRAETSLLSTAITHIPFPTDGWKFLGGGSEANESGSAKENRCRQLEIFLRTLCGIAYTGNIHPRMQEVAVHVQSFLGCDTRLDDSDHNNIVLDKHVVINTSKFIRKMKEISTLKNTQDLGLLLMLKRSFQRYVYRIFLLPILDQVVSQFIDGMKSRLPTASQMNAMKKKNRNLLKENAQSDLDRVKDFLDQMHDLIMDGIIDDFNAITKREEFSTLTNFFEASNGTHKSAFMTDCVREQVEIEIYLPLRSSISKHLVHGWRNDDFEMQFKMQELRKRPQSYFKIKPKHESPSDWSSVSKILNMGVGLSTLPCEKLQAIVDASKEIGRLYDDEHNDTNELSDGVKKSSNTGSNHSKLAHSQATRQEKSLSADDFLPIFIFCVVRAELERPCAMCILLKTLCEPSKRIGETGYYLASFEAAISHIADMDLSEGYGFSDNPPLL